MCNNKKLLYLFTDGFPYVKGEETFILPSLNEIKEYYNIVIIARLRKNVCHNKLYVNNIDKNIRCVKIIENSVFLTALGVFSAIYDKIWHEEFISIVRSSKNVFKKIIFSFIFYIRAKRFQYKLLSSDIFSDIDNSVYYTFWNNYVSLSLVLAKNKFSNIKLLSRIHGYDLYNERSKSNRQPFKEIMNKYENAIIFISEYSKKYYVDNFAKNLDNCKLYVSYLGIEKAEMVPLKPHNHIFTIVSCSNVIDIKRIDLIVEALSLIPNDMQIKWIHFGGGNLLNNIKKQTKSVLNSNIIYDLRGEVTNEEIIGFYEINYTDCFINVSSTEGLPVSIMEALKYGIPIIAPNIGAIHEEVDDNGILLSKNCDVLEIKNAIIEMYLCDVNRIRYLRESSQKIFNKKFYVKNSAKKLKNILDEMFKN